MSATVEQEDIIPNDYAGNMGYLILSTGDDADSAQARLLGTQRNRQASATILSAVLPKAVPTGAMAAVSVHAKMQARDPALPRMTS